MKTETSHHFMKGSDPLAGLKEENERKGGAMVFELVFSLPKSVVGDHKQFE